MRLYTKYKRLGRHRQNRWSGAAYATLTLGALVLLGWLWWSQSITVKRAALLQRANDSARASSSPARELREGVKPTNAARQTAPGWSVGKSANASNATMVTELKNVLPGATNKNDRSLSQSRASITNPAVSAAVSVPLRSVAAASAAETNEQPIPTRWAKTTLDVQIALARKGISSGSLDGKLGSQTRSALRAFQEREHLPPSGEPDAQTKALLPLTEPALATHVITTNDLARLMPVGRTWLAKSQQERLDYENILELVSENGHAHPGLIRTLNKDIDWTNVVAGTAITIPHVRYPPRRAKAAYVTIHLAEKTLQAFDASTNLLAHFPCSIAQRVEKRPVGQLIVEKLAPNPNYKFDPEVFPESAEARELGRILMIPPGPNNPVGSAWIGLNRPGYGIHGTPRPEEVGRTESHGCFRLANWNAEYLVQLVTVGTPVYVEP